MAELLGTFDAEGFYQAIDAVRKSRGTGSQGLQWKQVSEQSGVGAWTLTRLANGGRPDVDTLAALATWSGLDPTNFIVTEQEIRPRPEPLAMISTYLRSDPNLDDESKKAMEEIIKVTYERMRKSE